MAVRLFRLFGFFLTSDLCILTSFLNPEPFPPPPPPPLKAPPSNALPVPAVHRTWCRGFLLSLGRGCCAKIRRLFFEDGALKPTLAGLMSASGRQRRARLKKRPLVFAPPQCKRKPLSVAPAPPSPPPASTHHPLPDTDDKNHSSPPWTRYKRADSSNQSFFSFSRNQA